MHMYRVVPQTKSGNCVMGINVTMFYDFVACVYVWPIVLYVRGPGEDLAIRYYILYRARWHPGIYTRQVSNAFITKNIIKEITC